MRISNPDRQFARYRRTGDPDALARVFDRLAPELLAVARHLVPDAAEAEDVVQATFLAAIEGARSFDPERSVRPWLMGILARQAGLARRRLGRAPEPERLPARSAADPANEAQRAELRQAVEHALTRVPAPYSQVLAIHLAEGKRPAEIAQRLGRRAGTVRVQLHRGLELLRRALPAGFAAGVTLSMRAPRGLSAIKAEVLQHATATSVAAGAGPIVSGIGVWTMSKAGMFGAAALVAAAGVAYVVWPGQPEGSEQQNRETPRVSRGELRVKPPGGDRSGVVSPAPGEAPVSPGTLAREAVAAEAATEPLPLPRETAALPARLFRVIGKVLDAGDATGIAGARVILWLPADAAGERESVTVDSGPDGAFVAADVPAVPVSLSVSVADYAPLHAQPFRNLDPKLAPDTLDVGAVQVERGVRVTGRVVDARTRGGVADVSIFQFMALEEGLPRNKLGYGWRVAVTDADGTFELRDRLPYTGVHPNDHGFLAAAEAGLGWARFEALAGAGDEHEVVIELAHGASLTVHVTGDVTGDFNGERGSPVADASVVVDPLFDPFAFLRRFEPEFWHGSEASLWGRLSGRTDEQGRMTFADLPLPLGPDPVSVRVEVVAGASRRSTEIVLDPLGANELTIGLAEEDGLLITGRVEDELGRALPGASVASGEHSVEAGPGGAYELFLQEHAASDALVTARAEGHGRVTRRLDAGAGFPVRGLDFVLPTAAPIAGRVVDPDGHAVKRCHVSVSSRAADGTFSGDSAWVKTDDEGRFAFAHTTPGSWLVHVTPPYSQGGDASWAGIESLTVEAGDEDVVVVLARATAGVARVEARVFEAETGLALDPVEIHLTVRAEPGELATFPVHSDKRRVAGGVVLDNVRVGAWRLWVRAARGVPAYVDFDVEPGDEKLDLRVEVGDTASVKGRVLGLDPNTRYSGHVSAMLVQAHGTPRGPAWGEEGNMSAQATPDEQGDFELRDLLPGVYRLHYVAPGVVAWEQVHVRPGDATRLELSPVPSATVHVRGPEPEGEGFIRLGMRATSGSWDALVHYGQRKDGTFATTFFVPAGSWEWEASFRPVGAPRSEPLQTTSGHVSVAAGDIAEVWARIR